MNPVRVWLVMVTLFAAANVVAAGVLFVMWMVLSKIYPGELVDQSWPAYVLVVPAVYAAVIFLRGAMVSMSAWVQSPGRRGG